MTMTAIYDETLMEKLKKETEIARKARKRGFDPSLQPEIEITKDLAARVEALIGIKGISGRIRELEREGHSREEIALKVGYDFAEEKFGNYKRIEVIEHAVRTAVAILTEGVVAAPLDGIARVETGRNDDSSEYIKIFYSGPIRSAGGTAQALSVLVADYLRGKVGFAAYSPREEEIGRYILEVSAYAQISGLQYTPTDEEIREIVGNCPICIDGDPTEDREVGGYKDLERVATNKIRGGMVLVLTEGMAMKAPKIKRHVDKLGIQGWEWVSKLVKSKVEKGERDFLADVIAGRPVFGKPSEKGAFGLRYGRARNSGFASAGIHPAAMSLLEFTAVGTQLKPELPGKAACVVPVDSIEGPTVKLRDGSLIRLNSVEDVQRVREEIAEIVDLGEILIDYGEFLETGHRLMPGAYSHEWWLKELEASAKEEAEKWRCKTPGQTEAIEIASRFAVPLHPAYTYLWEDITEQDREYLAEWICEKGCRMPDARGKSNPYPASDEKALFIPDDAEGKIKAILEDLLVLHQAQEMMQDAGCRMQVKIEEPTALLRCLGITDDLRRDESAKIKTRPKAPTRIGMRMGRPEKSKERKMQPAPHSIFPVGEYGGKNRSLKRALKERVIEVEMGNFQTQVVMQNPKSKMQVKPKPVSSTRYPASRGKKSVDLWDYYHKTLSRLGIDFDINKVDVKCVKGLISSQKVAEDLGKGILRAKHGVFVFKDGTIRYDFTNLPLTHFKPKEIGLNVERAKELGYSHDLSGAELESDAQIVELKQQDVVISVDAASHLVRVSNFVDDLLQRFYDLPPYYGASSKEDLVGEVVLGLAPHTSAGILGRIIGFTRASACYAHPFFHAAKRRNCDGDEDSIILLLDALLNFSLLFLPEKRGGRMDAPIVLIPFINPKEVDKEAHNVSIATEYPLEFYEAACSGKHPKEVNIETAVSRIGQPKDVYGFGYTHDTTDIAAGPLKSLYKTLKTMVDKTEAQLKLARMIRAVDECEVAETVIKNHFLRDIKGNLRAFGSQKMRCSKCNAKYRRIPLTGKCTRCGSKIVPTVHTASIKKYLGVSLRIAEEYHISDYTRQRLELLEKDVNALFATEEEQKALTDFM
uniref:DNA polymerase II large subunit n=1 Tax=Candidatus Methanophagaceae archaeon ANME-1 ERB6 TaxID=2759912 RepID=A0A7G9YY95_9EURY|nr:DNA polymerase II large subunit [Methanosarcinales archaeon ANME-1 ERB6]